MTNPEMAVYQRERVRNQTETAKNPFNKPSPLPSEGEDNDTSPGAPRWWLDRLSQKLMDRQLRFDVLENYALGRHPNPIGDARYVKALAEIQRKSRTNYCELVIKATVQRMKVKAFRFGPVGEVDEEATQIWNYNDMDYQSPMNLMTAAVFGVTYGMVSPPSEPGGEPVMTMEDPRCCIVEKDPNRPTKTLASLRMWQDSILELIVAVLIVGSKVYTYYCHTAIDKANQDLEPELSNKSVSASGSNGWELISVEPNPLGEENPVVEGQWQPTHGDLSRAEHEVGLDIQDRINQTILERMVISKSQAFQQRWATGISLPKGNKAKKAPPWEPGADMLWITASDKAKFGEFNAADINQVLEAVRDDVGDFAAVTQTPATYLMNRMVNVSGDTLTQDQSALVSKVKLRMEAMGWFYERLMKLAFLYKKNNQKYKMVEAQTLWKDPEIHSFAEMGDFISKMITAEVPLELLLERADFSPDEIAWAIKEREKQREKQQEQMEAQADKAHQQAVEQIKAGGAAKAKPSSTSKSKPSSGSGSKSSS